MLRRRTNVSTPALGLDPPAISTLLDLRSESRSTLFDQCSESPLFCALTVELLLAWEP
jgi:hypothetical protein